MFYRRDNASKFAMIYMIEQLHAEGVSWIDCQVLTPTTEQFGAIEISREEFLIRLRQAIGENVI